MTTGDALIGKPLRRKEDARLLTGGGHYSDDNSRPDQLYVQFVRSPHAHAVIDSVDVEAARSMPGIRTVLTAADYLADGLGGIPNMAFPPILTIDGVTAADIPFTTALPMPTDKVRRVGEIVAAVVADTAAQALDAVERIVVDYTPLDAVTTTDQALSPGAPLVWEHVPGNLCLAFAKGDKAAADAAFARADHVTRIEVTNNRVTGSPMEPRAFLATYTDDDGFTLYTTSSAVSHPKGTICEIFGVPPDKARAVTVDVGGSFGTRGAYTFPEQVIALWAARSLGRPIKWTGTRTDCFLTDPAARDIVTRAELALSADGRILGLRGEHVTNIGAETVIFVPIVRAAEMVAGIYDIPAVHFEAKAVFTNTIPLCTYRGAGRPEGIYVIERLVDAAAAELGIDPVDLRRRNVIPPAAIPHTTATGVIYDSGEFERNLDGALALADWGGFEKRRAASAARGLRLGRGIGAYVDWSTGIPMEWALVTVVPEGRVEVAVGTRDSGQGHPTAYAQVIADLLGVPFDAVELHEGDTDRVKLGSGSHSSRSMRLASTLMKRASDEIIERGKGIAGHVLEAAPTDIVFEAGRFTVAGTDRAIGLFDVAREASENGSLPDEFKGPLAGEQDIKAPLTAFPSGCHVCEVEIDPETGAVRIVRHVVFDDVGRIINPLLVEGQSHGATAQGIGQALLEECRYDPATGQLLSATLMDYALPRADDLPSFVNGHQELSAPNNPLGIKGAGESGCTGAPPAVINAILDALRADGVSHIDMPATPERVWRAIRNARTG